MRRHVVISLLLLLTSIHLMAQMNTDRLTAIGRNALYYDDYVLSIQYFNQVIKLKPYLAEPYLYRAIAKIQLDDLYGAEKDCSQAITNSPFMPGAYYTRGYIYRVTGDYERAERDFTEALTLSPENKTYMLLRADVLSAEKKYDEALRDIDFLILREPETASYHFEKGVVCLAKEDTLCALGAFSKAVEYDGQNAANWSARGVVNSMLGHEDEALLDFNQAINTGTKWAGDYINRGILFYKQHNYRAAMSDYDKAVTLDPANGSCYYNRALLRQELGDYNNAIQDYDQALSLEPDKTEIHYQRGVVNMQLRQWEDALSDFEAMINRYPYFLPSYYLAAQAKTAQGDNKGAYRYRLKAEELEKKKEELTGAKVNTDVQLAQAQPQKKDRRKEFSNRAAQNQQENRNEDKYKSATRGAVQKKHVDVVNQQNVVLSYYYIREPIRQKNLFHYVVDDFNRRSPLPSELHFAVQEVALTADMVNRHFEQISRLTDRIEMSQEADAALRSRLLFARAMEFALVQDYRSAIEDCNHAIFLIPSDNSEGSLNKNLKLIAYFCRANWRYKLIDYQRSAGEEADKEQLKLEFEMMLRDYDQIILDQPDFAYAYYNKANMLCTQRDFKAAVKYYSDAIEREPEFAEAWFNRGLTYIYTDQTEKGLQDLSKAGELGIYQAYNLITRFK